jgi:hypothetical protein
MPGRRLPVLQTHGTKRALSLFSPERTPSVTLSESLKSHYVPPRAPQATLTSAASGPSSPPPGCVPAEVGSFPKERSALVARRVTRCSCRKQFSCKGRQVHTKFRVARSHSFADREATTPGEGSRSDLRTQRTDLIRARSSASQNPTKSGIGEASTVQHVFGKVRQNMLPAMPDGRTDLPYPDRNRAVPSGLQPCIVGAGRTGIQEDRLACRALIRPTWPGAATMDENRGIHLSG